MNPLEIHVVEIPYDDIDSSKVRPALIIKISNDNVYLFKVTSKYSNKSSKIKSFYYPLMDWKNAGLKIPSYIEIHKAYGIYKNIVKKSKLIGKLSSVDTIGLFKFINNRKK